MWIVLFDQATGREIGRTWRLSAPGPDLLERIKAVDFGAPDALAWVSDQEPEAAPLVATIEDRQVVNVASDPNYTPPAPAPDPVQARLEALEAAVAQNILASPHDRRWLAQKERAKLFGIPWLKAHPTASMQDLEIAVTTDLAQQFPGDPIVVSPGVIMSYAIEAAARGYIATASFEALRDLVVAASEAQLQAMLAAL